MLMMIDHFFINMKIAFIKKWIEYNQDSSFLKNLDSALNAYENNKVYMVIKVMTIGAFLVISGVSYHFVKNTKKRAIELVIIGILSLLIGNLLIPYMGFEPIRFGIISMFSVANLLLLIAKPLEKLKNKTWWFLYIIFIIVLMWVIDILANQYGDKVSNELKNYLLFLSGGFSNQLSYSDYSPLCLYTPILFIGALLGLFYKDKKSLFPKQYSKITTPINFMGKYAIIFYVAQIIIIYILLSILTLFVKIGR